MIKNYCKILFRHMKKNVGISMIHVACLTTGMICTILVFLWVFDEMAFDRFNEHADRITRVVEEFHGPDGSFKVTYLPFPLLPTLKQEYPEILRFTRFTFGHGRKLVSREDNRFYEERFGYADPEIVHIFSFPLIKGDPQTALSSPYSIVLTEDMARKYFGDEDAMGKILTLNHPHDLKVTGIMKNIPENSHLRFDFLSPIQFLSEIGQDYNSWELGDYQGYVLLRNRNDFSECEPVFSSFHTKLNLISKYSQ